MSVDYIAIPELLKIQRYEFCDLRERGSDVTSPLSRLAQRYYLSVLIWRFLGWYVRMNHENVSFRAKYDAVSAIHCDKQAKMLAENFGFSFASYVESST